ncbi:MAG: hypothetical protein JW909_06170 [Planctomycetes bacterium]|nr:hypothetical protein [Planctomycetota bacterium]
MSKTWIVTGLLTVMFLAAVCCGCSSKETEAPHDTSAGAEDVVDYFTGKAPVDYGNRMKKDIEGIQDDYNRRAEEILQDE